MNCKSSEQNIEYFYNLAKGKILNPSMKLMKTVKYLCKNKKKQ